MCVCFFFVRYVDVHIYFSGRSLAKPSKAEAEAFHSEFGHMYGEYYVRVHSYLCCALDFGHNDYGVCAVENSNPIVIFRLYTPKRMGYARIVSCAMYVYSIRQVNEKYVQEMRRRKNTQISTFGTCKYRTSNKKRINVTTHREHTHCRRDEIKE